METQTYKTRLEEMLKEITEELKTIGIHNPENEKDWVAIPEDIGKKEPDPNDAADKVEEWNERRALVATLETRYNNIKEALSRIEEKSFGKCAVCKIEIETDRLDAHPVAKTCKAHIEETV
jgi:RNA polymerase-binding transcription factor DksA